MNRLATLARCAAAVLVLSAGLAHADADTQFRQQFGDAFLDHYWSLHADDAIAMGYYRDADQLPAPDAKYRASLQRFLDGSIAQLEKLSAADMSDGLRTDRDMLLNQLRSDDRKSTRLNSSH